MEEIDRLYEEALEQSKLTKERLTRIGIKTPKNSRRIDRPSRGNVTNVNEMGESQASEESSNEEYDSDGFANDL